jgi:hypothetical protein
VLCLKSANTITYCAANLPLLLQLAQSRAAASDAAAQLEVLQTALSTLEAGGLEPLQRQYVDAVRRVAVVQV